jgi:hypothetical protein
MKLLTKEQEDAHYHEVLVGGTKGAALGLGVGLAASFLAQKRSPFYRTLTLPLKSFFVSSSVTFCAIVNADRRSRAYEAKRTEGFVFEDRTARRLKEAQANLTQWERAKEFGREYRYPIVTASWVASMGASLAMVSRNKYLSTPQKLVQARVYAQGLTLLVLIATAAFEVSDAREAKAHPEKVVHHEHYRGEDQWKGSFYHRRCRSCADKLRYGGGRGKKTSSAQIPADCGAIDLRPVVL